MNINIKEENLKEIKAKLWDFFERELSGKGYTNQEVIIAWETVFFAQTIKTAKKPENAELLKTIKELLE